jgi:hypothetical protein
MLVSLVLLTLAAALSAPPDTLVVCPVEFRPALVEWEDARREQGHEFTIIEPPATAERLRAAIREESKSGRLKYVVLIGDVPGRGTDYRRTAAIHAAGPGAARAANARTTIPTNYVRAKVNVRWGSDAHIASDIPYADVDEDGAPDLAIGRIPADSPAEVAAILRKSIDYERQCDDSSWERRVNIASGKGGFGAVTDALVEAAARQVIQQNVPACYETQHIFPGSMDASGRTPTSFAACAREQLSAGSLAWVYMGHGRATELDRVRTPTGSESILSIGDVPKLRCGGHSPLAVLVACSTGEMDAPRDCLAEELLKAEEGPVAVIAATRITMPYGNTVLGCEMLRACFRDRPEHLGDVLRLAGRRTLTPATDDYLRTSLDSLATGLSPQPADLEGERREHVLMYHLYGDPLLHLRYGETGGAETSGAQSVSAEEE